MHKSRSLSDEHGTFICKEWGEGGTPKATFLMGVYNSGGLVTRAIHSILSQSDSDFELIIVFDGSTQEDFDVLNSFFEKDHRLRIIMQENLGLTKSLNRGIRLARSSIIVRHDADDVSFPHRLETHLKHFKENPSLAVSMVRAKLVSECGKWIRNTPYIEHKKIPHLLSKGNLLVHGACAINLIRVPFSENLYDEKWKYAQDFELWNRLAANNRRFRISSGIQYQLTIAPTSISFKKKNHQIAYAAFTICRSLSTRYQELLKESHNISQAITRLTDSEYKNFTSVYVNKGGSLTFLPPERNVSLRIRFIYILKKSKVYVLLGRLRGLLKKNQKK